jgi:hypothetical protein
MLDSIHMSLPIELRGRIGGFTQLLKIPTDEKRLEFLQQKVNRMDEVIEEWLKFEFDKSAKMLINRAKLQRQEPGKTDRGKAYYTDIHNMFAEVAEVMKFEESEVKGRRASIQEELESLNNDGTLTPEKEALLEMRYALVQDFGDWKNRDAAAREAATISGWRAFYDGYHIATQKLLENRERLTAERKGAVAATNTEGTQVERDKRVLREGKWKWRDLHTMEGVKTFADYVSMGLMSFEQYLGWHFGIEAKITRKFTDWERQASYVKDDAMFAHQLELEEFFKDLAGGDAVAGLELQHRLQTETIVTKEVIRELSLIDMITARLMWRQDDGRRHMEGRFDEHGNQLSEWAYTQKFMDEIEGYMTDEAYAVEQFLIDSYSAEWEGLNEVHERVWHSTMPHNLMYAPLTLNPAQSSSTDMTDPTTGQSINQMMHSPTSLIRRHPNSIAEPRFADAIHQWYAHKTQIEHWKAYAEFNKDFQAIMANRDVKNAITAKTGREGTNIGSLWSQFFAMNGIQESANRIALMRAMQRGVNRLSQAALVGRLSVLAIQGTQVGAALAHMPAKSYMFRLGKAMTGQLDYRVSWNSKYIQRRIRQAPPAVRMAMEQMRTATPSKMNYQAYRLGKLISHSDAFFTAVTYAIIYDYQTTKLGKTPEAAEVETIKLTERVAQPMRPGTRSIFENTTRNPFYKLVWAFSSEPRQKLMLSLYATFTGRSRAEKARAMAVTFGFGGAFASVIRAIMADARDDDDDEIFDEKHWNPARLAAQTLSEPFSGIPGIGDVAQSLTWTAFKAAGAKPGYLPTGNLLAAPGRGAAATVHLAQNITDPFHDFDRTVRDIDTILNGLAPFSDTGAAVSSFSHLARDLFSLTKNLIPD